MALAGSFFLGTPAKQRRTHILSLPTVALLFLFAVTNVLVLVDSQIMEAQACATDTINTNEEGSCFHNPCGPAVLVTGANGYLGSHIVKELLKKNYVVHACVRDAQNTDKISHLLEMVKHNKDTREDECLKLFSTGDLGQPVDSSAKENMWDEPLQGVQAVIHSSIAMGWDDGLRGMYNPTLGGTRQLLEAVERRQDSVKSFVLTSSTAAVAAQMNGITDESHWRDAEQDIAQGSWYSATKIAQEQLVTEWAQRKVEDQTLPADFQFVSICPTRILGPPASTSLPIDGWMAQLRQWRQGQGIAAIPNDTIEFVHVQDVARMHIAVLEQPEVNGRFLCVGESWHWNDFVQFLHPTQDAQTLQLYGGNDKVRPKQYSTERRDSISAVDIRSMATAIEESIEYLSIHG